VRALLAIGSPLAAQWVNVATTAPRDKNGRPDLSAGTPLAADGKPDLSRTWAIGARGFSEGLDGSLGGKQPPLRPWPGAITEERQAAGGAGTPTAPVFHPGFPMPAIGTSEHPL
jgi:hypothetical protein